MCTHTVLTVNRQQWGTASGCTALLAISRDQCVLATTIFLSFQSDEVPGEMLNDCDEESMEYEVRDDITNSSDIELGM